MNDMIDVMSKICLNSDCNKEPSYNYINETKALYCKEHKKEDNMVDVKSSSHLPARRLNRSRLVFP